eukprot:1106001-Prymnesium_polylepis.2
MVLLAVERDAEVADRRTQHGWGGAPKAARLEFECGRQHGQTNQAEKGPWAEGQRRGIDDDS